MSAKAAGATLGVAFAGLQLVRPARTNPASDPGRALEAQVAVPPPVAATLDRACADCHSHRTRWPWYSGVAPASWLVVEHVDHGRRHLNFSDWSGQGGERVQEPLVAICKEVSGGRMPMRSYRLLHPEARLSATDVETICSWARSARRRASRGEPGALPR